MAALASAVFVPMPAGAQSDPEEPVLRLHGWAESGYTYASSGAGQLAVEPLLNRFGREFLANQIALVLDRPARRDDLSAGFYLQFFAGADAAALQGPGDIQSSNPRFGGVVRQVYAEAHLPALTEGGVDLQFGRQGSPMGFESYMAPRRPFYSLSYQWNYGEDGADTGARATWHVTERLDLTYGITLGSNTFFTLRGDAPCHLAQVNWWPGEGRKTLLNATLVIGDEAVGKTRPANPGSLATVVELRLQHARDERLTQYLQVNMGWDQDVPGVGLGQWYGALAAVVWKVTETAEAAVRLEWFDDVNGTRTGFATNYAALTAAATWRPRPWLSLRPEVRGDFAGREVFGPGSGAARTPRQLTAALECVFQF
jgi:hypothetical protein